MFFLSFRFCERGSQADSLTLLQYLPQPQGNRYTSLRTYQCNLQHRPKRFGSCLMFHHSPGTFVRTGRSQHLIRVLDSRN